MTESVLERITGDLPVFLLILFRVSGIMVVAPVLGNKSIPMPVKAFFSLVLAVLFYPLVDRAGVELPPNLVGYAMAVLWELSVGLLIGFVAGLLFSGIHFAGYVIDNEIGMRAASMLDPITNESAALIGQFKVVLAMLVYVLIDGHHFLVAALLDSFEMVPLLGLRLTDEAVLFAADTLMTGLFRIAIQIAAPTLVTMFLITVALGFMARTVPEMNIFVLGFAVKIGVGFLVLMAGVGLFVYGFEEFNYRHEEAVMEFLRLLGG